MKCNKCGFENNAKAKFCTKCGNPLESKPEGSSNNSKFIIVGLVAVIIILIAVIGYFAVSGDSLDDSQSVNDAGNEAMDTVQSSPQDESESSSQPAQTTQESSSQQATTTQIASESKSWTSIGSYSGSGSGSQTISVPPGKIMVKLSAYPIKNYATNHLYVSGSNGESGGVDWGSKSAVATRSDSFTYTSSQTETFEIDYYETVNWNVEFYIYE